MSISDPRQRKAVAISTDARISFVAGAGARSNPNIATFEDEMRRLGYTDARNVTIDYLLRSVDLSSEALTEAIAAQIGRGGEVIVAYGPERTLKSAVAATRSIPIVMAAIDYDPLAKGYIARTRRRSRRNERLRRSRSSSSAAATRSQRVSSPA